MRTQPLICVRDVEASSRWYQRLLGCQSDHGGPQYERLVSSGGLILQLHRWDVEHHHGRIGGPNLTRGNGVLLWFEVGDFEAAAGAPPSCMRRSSSRAIAIHRTGTAARTIGSCGCVIPTATPSCLPARTGQRMETGNLDETCVAYLRAASPPFKVMITSAIPVIAVSDSARSEDYYCQSFGIREDVRLANQI